MFNNKRLDSIINKIDDLRCITDALELQLGEINMTLHDLKLRDSENIQQTRKNIEKVQEMTCELKGVVSMARAAVAKRKQKDQNV